MRKSIYLVNLLLFIISFLSMIIFAVVIEGTSVNIPVNAQLAFYIINGILLFISTIYLYKGEVKEDSRKKIVHIFGGTIIYTVSIFFFYIPADLMIGGITGLAKIVTAPLGLYDNPLAFNVIYQVLNVILLIFGLITLGRKFFFSTILSVAFYTIVSNPLVWSMANTSWGIELNNYLVTTAESNFFLWVAYFTVLISVGMGIIIRAGGTTGGVDIIQMFLKKTLGIPFSASMYIVDGIIITLGAVLIGLPAALLALLTTYFCGVVIDKTIFFGTNKSYLRIITSKVDEIKKSIYEVTGRGSTIVNVLGGYKNENRTMVTTVIDTRSYQRIVKVVEEIDPDCFCFISQLSDVRGLGFREEDVLH